MGDRATIAFMYHQGKEMARVYVHNRGSRADELLAEFFATETSLAADNVHDLRWFDPNMLAARFVAWMSRDNGLGVGVVTPDCEERQHWQVRCVDPNGDRSIEPTVWRIRPQVDTTNDFLFGINGHGVIAPTLPVGPMDRTKALRAAAWLSFLADPSGDEFADVLEAIRST